MPWPSQSPPTAPDRHLRIVGCPPVEFAAFGKRYAVCAPWSVRPVPATEHPSLSGPRWQHTPGGFHDQHVLAVLLRDADVSRLRSLLADETSRVHSLADRAVRDAVARLIHRRTLTLLVASATEVTNHRAKAVNVPTGRGADTNGPRSTPSSLRPITAPAVAPIEPAAAPDPIASLDQDRQALVLILAALHGLPFCEECARRERQHDALVDA